MSTLTINGIPRTVEQGTTLLQAIRQAGIEIPSLCHDPRISAPASCRLCVVEISGSRPKAACSTTVADGMLVETHSPAIEAYRRTVLQLLLQQHPDLLDPSPVETELDRYLKQYGLLCKNRRDPPSSGVDDSHPYIRVDLSRCVLCYRCVRICEELQGQFVWREAGRGTETQITHDGASLRESGCVSCGACADTCPTGALEDKSVLLFGAPTAWTRTVCPYCGVGCAMDVGTRDGRIVQVKPVTEAAVSKGHLCVKGRYAFTFVDAADRVTEPMIRTGDAWRTVSWDEAARFVADRLAEISAEAGADSIGILGSARATNEENYITQKFARIGLGTNNVDSCARVCHAPSAAALGAALGTGAATNSFDDIEAARTILLVGCNPTENHPVVGARIKQAALCGTNLIVIDPRRTELARYAHIHLQPRPGTDIPLLQGLAAAVVLSQRQDKSFITQRVTGWETYESFLHHWAPEHVAQMCGVSATALMEAARLYATAKPAMSFHGLGLTEHVRGTDAVRCLINLALLTGNIGKRGAGINPLRGQNNVQGAAHMGCEPDHLPGYAPLGAAADRFEDLWEAAIPRRRGLRLPEMMEAARKRRLKALWAIGYDVLMTLPDVNATRKALANLELLIVQDMFLTETAREFGTVFLPAASSFEKEGTFMNSERRVQRIRAALSPKGDSRPDWQIIRDVAGAMGKRQGFAFQSSEEIWNEIREAWPEGRGMSYQRLTNEGLQWPCPALDQPGTAVLHEQLNDRKFRLSVVEGWESPESASPEFPLLLLTGRNLFQFNAATMTGRTPNQVLRPNDEIELSPEDAQGLRLENGNTALIRSRYGQAELPVRVSSYIKAGTAFATFHQPSVLVNQLTGGNHDSETGTPEYKLTAVLVVPVNTS